MKKLYSLFVLLAVMVANQAIGQLNYLPANGLNTTTTYASISATGTTIATANTDDANSAPVNIGFTFTYNGANFTQFIFSTNGFIKLGATAPASAAIFGGSQDATGGVMLSAGNSNCIVAFNHDLMGTGTTEYKVLTTGIVGSRVTTIEWKNVTEKTTSPVQQFSSIDFQIKLYEGSNVIELVYANFVPTANADNFKTSGAGLLGTDNVGNNVVYVRKGSTGAWNVATFENGGAVTTQILNWRRTVAPDNGRTFRFTPTFANDLTITRIETLGKLPLTYTGAHAIKALITNIGTNAIATYTATLTITGSNTYTNAKVISTSTASGATSLVTFDPFTFTNAGTNTVTVTLTPDDNNSNNTSSLMQEVGSVFSFADNSPITGSVGYNTGAGLILTKYKMNGTGFVTAVNVSIASAAATAGNSVSGVVLNTAGTIIGSSPAYTIVAGDLGNVKTFIISTPPSIANDSFYVGLAQTANAVTGYFPVNLQNEGLPTRDQAYWTAPIAGGVTPTVNTTIGRFYTEAVVSSTPVFPVKLSTFTGIVKGEDAILNWSTSTEVNNRGFEIQKSPDGNDFATLGFVAGAGNSTNTNNYQFADKRIATGNHYYRLKQVDEDGRFTYSAIIKLNKSAKNDFDVIVINPSKDKVILQVNSETSEKISVNLFNLTGQLVATQNTTISAGNNSLTIGNNLSKGTYVVAITKNGSVSSYKVIVE